MRCLILHVPSRHDGVNEIMVMPMGLLSLAGALRSGGHDVAVVHLGLEQDLDPSLTVEGVLARTRPDLLLVSLHWARQIRPVGAVCETARRALPGLRIVLGGFTTSFFASEILEAWPFVDCCVRGDGEGPAVALADALERGGDLAAVPNLLWREGGETRDNRVSFFLDRSEAEALDHACFGLVRHSEEYLGRCLYADFDTSTRRGGAQRYGGAFYYNPGRGCPYRCAACGGTYWARELVSTPARYFFFSTAKALRDIERAARHGARCLRISFDPSPRRDFYIELFRGIRQRGLELQLVFDCFSLPDERFLAALAETFDPSSVVVVSAECGNEEVRRRNRGAPFTNRRLVEALARVGRHGLQSHAFLSAGLPFETRAMVAETEALIALILERTGAAVTVCPMELDPGSRIFLDPDRFGVTPRLRTFRDFVDDGYSAARPYYSTEHMTEPEILEALAGLSAKVHELDG